MNSFTSRISSGGYPSILLCMHMAYIMAHRGFRARVSSLISDPFLSLLIREAKTAQTVSENFSVGVNTSSSWTHLDLGS